MLRPSRNNSDNVSRILNTHSEFLNTSPAILNPVPIFTIDDEQEEISNEKDILLEENELLRKNMEHLIKNYPKEEIYKKILNDKCSICLEKFDFDENLALTNCYHLFHKTCIDESINNNCTNCPKCRFNFNSSIFLYLKMKLELGLTEFY